MQHAASKVGVLVGGRRPKSGAGPGRVDSCASSYHPSCADDAHGEVCRLFTARSRQGRRVSLVTCAKSENWCHCVRKARERRKRLELGNLSSEPCG